MAVQIVVPTLGESVTEATVAKWFKQVGDAVAADEPLVELETDKVTVEVPAPAAGTLASIDAPAGSTVAVGGLLGQIGAGSGAQPKPAPAKPTAPAAALAPAAKAAAPLELAPAVRRLVEENKLDPAAIAASGKDGRLTKEDVVNYLEAKAKPAAPAPAPAPRPAAPAQPRAAHPREERVRMTRLRKRIAERLKEAQNTAAMLTTFNEVDMTALMAIRNQYKDAFEKKHGVRIGFMSFFVRACLVGLKEFPAVNAEIDGDDIVYKNHYDIGVAVGTPQGLVVPVLRDADQLSLAGIEKAIGDLGKKARDGKLAMEDLQGGTFTISNGGVYGSLMSTPILNPPQSGILGMHKIQERPMAVNGQVVIRPMMYLALSYDHRIIDGREAVSFLVRVKESLEDPQRILLDL
ncbi:MAG: 2-oxoglutarate dehydrogenase complex dihydrolipoyllysine-residue succinyltransferase [Rhodospirillales bacterium]|nr:2-oxoglutarate dehydrogenase complex dihydrolipoyllysine-residue succinyltransferase [Rhodospirillales bacterium]